MEEDPASAPAATQVLATQVAGNNAVFAAALNDVVMCAADFPAPPSVAAASGVTALFDTPEELEAGKANAKKALEAKNKRATPRK